MLCLLSGHYRDQIIDHMAPFFHWLTRLAAKYPGSRAALTRSKVIAVPFSKKSRHPSESWTGSMVCLRVAVCLPLLRRGGPAAQSIVGLRAPLQQSELCLSGFVSEQHR